MGIAIDMDFQSYNHFGEELCGDKVAIVTQDDYKTMILADGMGSGVRANILATLTTKILETMMIKGMKIDDAVETIAKTLPLSSVNGAAYATFSIVQIFNNGKVNIIEYDNPECIYLRDGVYEDLPFETREVCGKEIRECTVFAQPGDSFVIMSDGCLYCGTEQVLNYEWDRKALCDCAIRGISNSSTAFQMASFIGMECKDLYGGMPSDDTTVAVARISKERIINIMTGPASKKEMDGKMVLDFMEEEGVKIVCGGITGEIVSREICRDIEMMEGDLDDEIPPAGRMDGVDLVTEGVLTLNKLIKLLTEYSKEDVGEDFFLELAKENGATRIMAEFMEGCTKVNLYVGTAVNEAYADKDIPFEMSVRQNTVNKLIEIFRDMHLQVNIKYF